MTALLLIEEARAEGLELRANGDKLKYSGPAAVVERWKPMLVGHKPEIMAALSAPRSTWWLVHYLDGAPVEVWTDPPATHAEILERRPDAIAAEPINQDAPGRRAGTQRRGTRIGTHAIAAEPINQDAPAPITACSTCSRASYRGACGKPVAAGLSDLDGVIVYHGNGGKDCPAWLAILDTRLEECILAMAERRHYSGDDLAAALFGARSDPAGWWRVVDADEAFEERAAIMQYDGGLSREEAEIEAAKTEGVK